jgi:tol-pal system protein YbgF
MAGFGRRQGLPVMLLGAALLLAPAAGAQDRSVEVLQQELQRLQRDIADLQRQVYAGRPPAGGGATAPAGAVGTGNPAQTELRLTALENELRTLTGRVEQVDFQMRQVVGRLDKLVADIDFRLQQIEERTGTGAPPPTASGPAGPVGGAQQRPGADAGRQSAAAQPAPPPTSPAQADTPPATTAARTLPQGSPMDQYNYAFSLLRRSAFAEAEQAFREFLAVNPQDKLAGNAQYWLGETYFVRGQYEQAATAFVDGYRNYPDSAKATDTLLKLGMTLRRLGQDQEACATFGELDRRFPDANPRLRERAGQERQAAGCG